MDRLVLVVFSVFVIVSLVACTDKNEGVQGGPAKPTVSITPVSTSTISITDTIVFTFGKSMDVDSLSIGGSLGANADAGSWGTFNNENDTLTVAPNNIWPVGDHDLTIDVNSSEGAVIDLNLNYTVASAPSGSANPPSGSRIQNSTAIVITFDKSMDPSSLSLVGSTMVSDGGQWSTTTLENNTLTLSPVSNWEDGEQTLVYQVSSAQGISSAVTTLAYHVDSSAPTVSAEPQSGATIQDAVNIVLSFSETMDRNTFSPSGTLWDESSGNNWSSNLTTDDTFTVSPATSWSDGAKVLNIAATDLAGNSLSTSFSYVVDATLPVASASPGNNTQLEQTTSVVITFTESMNTDSLSASGSLWDQSDGGIWSSGTNVNDTLTISPSTQWALGGAQLTLNASDLYSNPMATLSLNFNVGCPAGQTNCSGACVDTDTNESHCGACGNLCGLANATSICTSGNCIVADCNAGFSNCNGNSSDGCEVSITSDASNCGGCGVSCNDSITCTNDTCASGQCANSSNCTPVYGSWGACSYPTACAETGSQSRTVTPRVCTPQGCSNGTPYTQTRSCTRDTDGNSCGPNRICIMGICEVIL